MVLMVSDVELEMEVFVLQELLLVVEFLNLLLLWILHQFVVIMIFLFVLMVEIRTQEICVRLLLWVPVLLWLVDWLLVVSKVQELLLIRMVDL
jgi:hypothetical protein